MKRVLVTGAAGFVGRHLVERLVRDEVSVRALVHRTSPPFDRAIEMLVGDVQDPKSAELASRNCDTVVHLASIVHDVKGLIGADQYRSVIVDGSRNMFRAAALNRVSRLVFVSSLSVYGRTLQLPCDEKSPCRPSSPYGLAKLEAENYLRAEGSKLSIQVTCLRPAMVYGAGCKGNLPRLIALVDRGLCPPLPATQSRRSMVHVSDLVEAILLVIGREHQNGETYIVTDGRPYSTRELYEMICRGLGKQVPRWQVPLGVLQALARAGDAIGRVRGRRFVFDSDVLEKLTGNAWYSSEKMTKELGYYPRVTFEDALPELIAWYRSPQGTPVKT